MRNPFRFWTSLARESRDYILIYAWGTLWPTAYFFFTPLATSTVLNKALVGLWCGVAVLGSLIGIYGLLRKSNLLVERVAVWFLMVGPVALTMTQTAIITLSLLEPSIVPAPLGGTPFDRFYVLFLGFWAFWWLNKRRRQLKERVNLVKDLPLESETEADNDERS